MSDGYAKLFADIVDSSIWDEPPETCKVWVTLLALCNADGFVRGSVGWLAGKSKVTNESCLEALSKFESPDPKSRTPDNDGKRIETLDDGWLVLNYLSFRDRLSSNPKAVATRIRVQKHRDRYNALRNAKSVTSTHSASASASASASVSFPVEGVKGEKYHKDSRAALYILNEASGRHFRETDTNLAFISARLSESDVTIDGVRQMITRQCKRWIGTDQAEYLRPETLFNKTKFDGYYAAKDQPVIHENNNRSNAGGDKQPINPVRGSSPVGGF